MIRPVWAAAGMLALGLGAVGIFLPFLPTVPFLLLAAFCFGQSSRRLHRWLLSHPTFGPPIRDWNARGAIGRPAKYLATASILAAPVLTLVLGFGPAVLAAQLVALAGVTIFIWTRPD